MAGNKQLRYRKEAMVARKKQVMATTADYGGIAARLSNERTLSAWCQTGILTQVSGFALTQLGNSTLRGPVGTLLILAGGGFALIGYQRYQATEARLGESMAIEPDRRPLVQTCLVVGIAVLMAGLQIAGVW